MALFTAVVPSSGGGTCSSGCGVAAGSWLEGGAGVGWAGGCWAALFEPAFEEDVVEGPGAPMPGVMGPVPGSGVGACGVGASGTDDWASATGPKTSAAPRSAASEMALARSIKAFSSSPKFTAQGRNRAAIAELCRTCQSIRRIRRPQVAMRSSAWSVYALLCEQVVCCHEARSLV